MNQKDKIGAIDIPKPSHSRGRVRSKQHVEIAQNNNISRIQFHTINNPTLPPEKIMEKFQKDGFNPNISTVRVNYGSTDGVI